jgi:hypothetical protein
MRSSLAKSGKPLLLIRLTLLAILTLLLSGWTCSVFFASCQGVGSQFQATSLLPNTIARDTEPIRLTVGGSGFDPRSTIMWNGNALETTFVDSQHLQAEISQQTFESFGGSPGNDVQISVKSPRLVDHSGCPVNGNSAFLFLAIN